MELAKVCAEQDQLQMALEHINKVSEQESLLSQNFYYLASHVHVMLGDLAPV